MIASPFEIILEMFSPFFHIRLKPDHNQTCLIKMKSGLSVQIELDRYGSVLIGCRLGPLPVGSYRTLLLQQALKSNASTPLASGTFGFCLKSGYLTLFLVLNPDTLNTESIAAFMPPFLEKGELWHNALTQQVVPQVMQESKPTNRQNNIFNMVR